MKQRDFIDLISGAKRGAVPSLLRGLLRLLSFWFWLGAITRIFLYRMGLLRGVKADAPVICVGNITTGGTGKTPAVAWVVNTLRGMGHEPWILSRGYKSDASGNDEMKVLNELCPGVHHLQDPNRVAAAHKATHDGAKLLVLDDGFSHLRLKRDLDILLFDSLNPFGYGRMLPRGLLREPLSNVRRAKFAIFSRADLASKERLRDLEDTIRCKGFTGGVAHAAHEPVKLVRIGDDAEVSLDELKGAVVAPFCGIGNPRGFERTLESLGAKLSNMGTYRMDDHAAITERVLTNQIVPFIRTSHEVGATCAVCTQKDA
ncbi:MAG: tetraacyldisaccharide 4'-kinase, partial [Planctomycetes bacterium]|nr:tetraacyldisaccharide 4'-kinase [Planctomycetota bacterium]